MPHITASGKLRLIEPPALSPHLLDIDYDALYAKFAAKNCKPKHWYYGHFHASEKVTQGKFTIAHLASCASAWLTGQQRDCTSGTMRLVFYDLFSK